MGEATGGHFQQKGEVVKLFLLAAAGLMSAVLLSRVVVSYTTYQAPTWTTYTLSKYHTETAP